MRCGGIGRLCVAVFLTFGFSTPVLSEEISLRRIGGVYEIPIEINQIIRVHCIIDTGAAEVFIPADLVEELKRNRTISKEDYLSHKIYTLADGSTVKSSRVLLRQLKIGSYELENVPASVSQPGSPLLLGQSLLEKFGSYTIDNQRQVLVLGDKLLPQLQQTSKREIAINEENPTETYSLQTPTGAIRSFYSSVDQERFDRTWASLSTYSQNQFVARVAKVTSLSPEKVRQMFDENDAQLRDTFWKSFRNSSKIPELFANASFRLLSEEEGIAMIEISSSGKVIRSVAYQEGDEWRIGYMESFLIRRKAKNSGK